MTTRQHLPAGLDAMAPGPELAVALGAVDPSRLVGADTVTYLRGCFRQHNHTGALLLAAVREAGLVEGPDTLVRAPELDDWSPYEASAALGWSVGHARTRLGLSDDLARRLPAVAAAHRSGDLDEPKVRAFAEWTLEVPADTAREVARVLLPTAPSITVGRLVQRIQELLRALDPEWADRREAAAVGSRRLSTSRNPSGSAELAGHDLPLERVVRANQRIHRLAGRARHAAAAVGVTISVITLRADVFLGLLDGSYHGLDDDTIIEELLDLHRPYPEADDPGPGRPGPDGPVSGPDRGSGPHGGPGPDGGEGPDDPPGDDPHEDAEPAHPRGTATPIPVGPGRFREPGTLRPLSPRECVELRVRLTTVLGLDDHPGELPGWGSVSARLARDTLAGAEHAEWRIVITDEAGHLLHVALTRRRPRPDPAHPPPRHPLPCVVVELQVPLPVARTLRAADHGRYRSLVADVARIATEPFIATATSATDARRRFPTAALARWVHTRDRHCAGPMCTRPARACDLDHTLDHALGGPTVPTNLGCDCRRCHRLKHVGRWRQTQPSEGVFRWTARSGTVHHVPRRPVAEALPDPRPSTAEAPRPPRRLEPDRCGSWDGWDDDLHPEPSAPAPPVEEPVEPDF